MLVLLAAMAAADGGDAPEISRSRGPRDGVVVMWPRVVPGSEDPQLDQLTAELRQHLVQIAGQVASDDVRVDVRPAPERACPRKGCRAATVGAVLAHEGGGCAVVGLVTRPGTGGTVLVPWAGDVDLGPGVQTFREPPESLLTVQDFVPCDQLSAALPDGHEAVLGALREALQEL